MKLWVNRETALTVGGERKLGKVISNSFQMPCNRGSTCRGVGYAFLTEEGEEIRFFTGAYPRAIAIRNDKTGVYELALARTPEEARQYRN